MSKLDNNLTLTYSFSLPFLKNLSENKARNHTVREYIISLKSHFFFHLNRVESSNDIIQRKKIISFKDMRAKKKKKKPLTL